MSTNGRQICSECHELTNQTISNWWNAERGQVIGKDEKLCCKCADKRGFAGLPAINKEYGKKLK